MKNQEITVNPIQTKKEWIKPELLTEEVERTLSGASPNPTESFYFHS
ncbi:hypothetical protein [Pedobacter changchengzhani]|nr:hypothetical protein [Pedobacter changchengzhani]